MWRLTPDVLRATPTTKADDVLLMLTDYNKNRPVDRELLDLLFSQYKHVYFWPQGSGDARYVGEFAKPADLCWIGRLTRWSSCCNKTT